MIKLKSTVFVFATKNSTYFFTDQLCNCPQKCGEKIPMEIRTRLFADYYKLGDHLKQNYYLQSYIEMRSVHKRLYQEETRVGGRLQRRVSCKYRIPIEIPPSHPSENLSAEDLKSKYCIQVYCLYICLVCGSVVYLPDQTLSLE